MQSEYMIIIIIIIIIIITCTVYVIVSTNLCHYAMQLLVYAPLSLFSLRTGFDKSPFSVDVPILHLFASAQDVDTVHLSEAVPHRGGVGGERGGDG